MMIWAVALADHREREIAEIETKLVLHRRPESDDRPGARDQWDNEVLESLGIEFEPQEWMERFDMPSELWLPLPPEVQGNPTWSQTVRDEMAKHRRRWKLLPPAFDGELALDIAILGGGTNARDVDNLAHDVVSAFEELYCRGRRGTVTGAGWSRRTTSSASCARAQGDVTNCLTRLD